MKSAPVVSEYSHIICVLGVRCRREAKERDNFRLFMGMTRKCQNCPVRENQNWTILGVKREFAPNERVEDTADGIWSTFQAEKRPLDFLISIAKQILSRRLSPSAPPGTLKIVFQLKLLSAGASLQLRQPDNLRTFVSSPHLRQIQGSTTTDAQYQRTPAQFRRRPDPPGQVLNWVCRDKLSYLDLTENRLEMDPEECGVISE